MSNTPETHKHKLKKHLRGAISEPARAARLQRIYARLQEGCTVSEIAALEGLTPARVRQILDDAAKSKRPEDRPCHARMQVARLAPVLKGLVASATQGETENVPKLLRALAQLDRYAQNNIHVGSPSPETLGEGSEEHSAVVVREQTRVRETRALELSYRQRPRRLDRSLFNGADFFGSGFDEADTSWLTEEGLGKEAGEKEGTG